MLVANSKVSIMKWQKIKQLFVPDNHHEWMVSHAANPFAKEISPGIFRIYFTCRNTQNMSHIGYVDIDFENNFKIISISNTPVLSPGEPGMFDDSGVAMGYLIKIDGKELLYYLGWNLKVTVPWLNTIGLAVYDADKKQFIKTSRAPVMDRSDEDPFSISYPCILFDNEKYKMWYGSNLKWGKDQAEMSHVIKYAESKDGFIWHRHNQIHIGLMHTNEYALSKPYVIKDNSIYRMWYSYRGNQEINTYRIGYAESSDSKTWTRKDEDAGISISQQGWDSEMVEYPFVFRYKNNLHMLYNGNGFGKTGFGLAVLD